MLPKISLVFLVWYLIPPERKGATHVTATGLKPLSPEEAPLIQETVETTPTNEIPIAKLVIMAKKTEKGGKKMVTPTIKWE